MSKKEAKKGDVYNEVLKKNLKNSQDVCILLSSDSLDNHQITTDWAIGWALDKKMYLYC